MKEYYVDKKPTTLISTCLGIVRLLDASLRWHDNFFSRFYPKSNKIDPGLSVDEKRTLKNPNLIAP